MAIEDLDLEFEEEEEEQSDALDVDVDLSFSASVDTPKQSPSNQKVVGNNKSVSADDATNPNLQISRPQKAATTPTAKPTQMPKAKSAANVANIAQQRAAKAQAHRPIAQARPTTQQVQSPVQVPVASDDLQLELDSLRMEIDQLRSEIKEVKSQADVRVAVAEAKTEFMIEYITNAKLLDHQVNQILQRIHKKVPALKTEVLTVKKYLTEFLEKNAKKK